jgi:hypothetical protein
MKRTIMAVVLAFAAVVLAGTAAGDPGKGHGKGHERGEHGKPVQGQKFTFQMTSADGSSCGADQPWAQDVFTRKFKIERTSAGFKITRRDRGTFTTNGVLNPGRCETTRHGQAVRAGVTGKFHGFLKGTLPSTFTFNPDATCPADCGATDVFLNTFFGAGAANAFSCFQSGFPNCSFDFEYSARAQGLKFHHWKDVGRNGTEKFRGDIADR